MNLYSACSSSISCSLSSKFPIRVAFLTSIQAMTQLTTTRTTRNTAMKMQARLDRARSAFFSNELFLACCSTDTLKISWKSQSQSSDYHSLVGLTPASGHIWTQAYPQHSTGRWCSHRFPRVLCSASHSLENPPWTFCCASHGATLQTENDTATTIFWLDSKVDKEYQRCVLRNHQNLESRSFAAYSGS